MMINKKIMKNKNKKIMKKKINKKVMIIIKNLEFLKD